MAIVELASFNPQGAHTRNASLGSVVTLTPPTNASYLLIQALAQNVRYTLDGTTPTASAGFQLVASDPPLLLSVRGVASVKVIQETTGAEVQYQWGQT